MKSRIAYWAAAAALLGFQATVMVTSALQESQTFDEATHLAAGYGYLKGGYYHFNFEHPPLGKILAALPLLPLKPRFSVDEPSWGASDHLEFARIFLYENHIPADTMLFRGRLMTMLATLGLGVALLIWTTRHFGAGAGLLALFLYTLDPNVTAHGRYVTNDLLISLFLFLAVIAWIAWLRTGKTRQLLWAALALAMGLLSKFSALILLPLLLVLCLIKWWQRRADYSVLRLAAAGLVLAAVSIAAIALAYARETKRLTFGGPAQFQPSTAAVGPGAGILGLLRHAGRVLKLPPYSYLVGLKVAAEHYAVGHASYLLGRRSEKGWWYYFPVAFAVKTPSAALLLTALSLALMLSWLLRRPLGRLYHRLRELRIEWYALALPAAAYFLLWMPSSINIGLRHILPAYPFLFVLVAAVVVRKWPPRLRRALPVVLCATAALQVCESLRTYPHYLAFFNTLSGGPARGPDYLLDSNIDWGQDLKKLKA
ncbi:MAG: phospholipid carrier-dependent glycosyltransferase, partial [Acidobacteria bacterium]|nr:phospholipid carrier-dependent glycosyltransferase [Acidobacteriota bacterium]